MDIKRGFKIDEPNVFVPWEISEDQLHALLGDKLRVILKNKPTPIGHYSGYSFTCKSLSGLNHELGFDFKDGSLFKLGFFINNSRDQQSSFEDFQRYFQRAFGPPTKHLGMSEGYPKYEWDFGNVTISHYVFDRFGPEEHMEITRNWNPALKTLKEWAIRVRG